jgi:hypothetical protein
LFSRFSNNPAFAAYRQQTSILIPLPPALYRDLPGWVKGISPASLSVTQLVTIFVLLCSRVLPAVLLFEWPVYASSEADSSSAHSLKASIAKSSDNANAASLEDPS